MKKMLPVCLRSLVIAGLIMLFSFSSKADHIVGMDLGYTYLGGTNYRISLVIYGDCGSTTFGTLSTAAPRICIYRRAASVTNLTLAIDAPTAGTEITPVCPSSIGLTTCTVPGSSITGIKRFVYSAVYSVPDTSGLWRFVFNGSLGGTSAGRATNITNINTTGSIITQLTATLDNRFTNNSSPALTVSPTPYFCQNNTNSYNPGAVDPDGDSLSFSLIPGRLGSTGTSCTISTASVTYIGNAWTSPSVQPVTATTPLRVASASNYSFDATNGQISFIPNVTQRALVVYNIAEYRGGVFVGSSQREMTFLVQVCTVPPPAAPISSPVNCSITDSVRLQVCLETGPFSFHLLPTSTDPSLNIEVSAAGIPAGATFSVTGDSTSTPDATFSWTSTGVTPGLYTIFVTYKDDQCPISGTNTIAYSITINSVADITGTPVVCAGDTTFFSNTTPGGFWSSSNPTVAMADAGTGIITGVSGGTATITYTVGTCFKTLDVTVNPLPANITGSLGVCVGFTTALTSATPGGIWSSSTPSVGTISATGVVNGISAGATAISYTLPATGCAIGAVVTVNALPGAISGTLTVCQASTTTLSNATPGGTWSSSTPSVAAVGTPTSGVITGVTAGTATITYTLGTGCVTTAVVTVNALPGFINPITPTILCIGNTATFTNGTAGGAWSSSSTLVATVSAGGLVTGVGAGTAAISYTLPTGCLQTKTVTVNTTPAAIVPASVAVCTGSNVTLSNTVTGGTWSSSNTLRATVGSSTGIVTGVVGATAGTVNITYAIGTCTAIRVVTVNVTPGAITGGVTSLCTGGITTWGNATPGGSWSSSNIAVATVGSGSGAITAIATGTANITYTIAATGCFVTRTLTVNVTPGASLPVPATVCAGSSITFTNATAGGTWASSNPAVATIGSATGIANGITAGTASITYAIGSCNSVTTLTVNVTPLPIAPGTPVTVCVGATTTLTNATPGGVWSSSNPAVATIGITGIVTGVTTGTTTISYTLGGCSVTKVVTVGTTPIAILPTAPTVCVGGTATLSNPIPGGTWSSGNPAVATIGSATGVVSGVALGTSVITYSISGCFATVTITVNTLPSVGAISGPSLLCVSVSGTYTNPTPGGVWSTTLGNATITSGGVATGVAVGVDTIRYSVTNGCGTVTSVFAVTVNPFLSAGTISGPTSVCVSGLITLTSTVAGGVWSSSNASATAGSTSGIITGVLPGLDTITYTVTGICGIASSTYIITVNALPTSGTISGPGTVCVAANITLTSSVAGGTWSAANSTATVGSSSGIVTGVTAGTNTITYSVSNTCGTATTTRVITVNPLPNAGTISGPDSVCISSTITLTSSAPGGVWTAGNANATVSGAGVVTGVSAGTVPISYTVTNVCGTISAVKIITVVPPPNAGVISGPSNVCVGAGITLTSSAPTGTWSSSNGNAIISGPGIVVGVLVGTSTISYSVTNLCGTAVATRVVSVNPVPVVAPVTGPTAHCVGTTITKSSATPGGNWTSSNMAVATVGLSTGIVTGVSAGVVDITYTVTNSFGCPTSVTGVDTVYAVPVVPAIAGSTNVCLGSTTTLTNTTTGGTWSSTNLAAATIDAAGVVSGLTLGTTTISYTVNNICGTTSVSRVQTVTPLPAVTPISGITHQCVGGTTTLTNATAGGTWSSADVSIATAGLSTGDITGVLAGITTITYTITDVLGCSNYSTTPDTVIALPVVAAITGTSEVCLGGTTILSNATSGGVWSSTDMPVATVGSSSGIVTGATAGTATISYSVTAGTGCVGAATTVVTVNALPTVAPITGTTAVCEGSTTTLSSATTGGVWSSSDVSIAFVDAATGVVTGVIAGTVTITYTFTDGLGCSGNAVAIVTVNALPIVPAITGTPTVCVAATTTLSNTLAGGAWSSSDVTTATVGVTTGVVTGVAAGVATITYSYTDGLGCTGFATMDVTVNGLPTVAPITGVTNVCVGATSALSNTTPGGTWSSSSTAIATVSASGVVSGISGGIVTIFYSVTDGLGCTGVASTPDTVNVIPVPTPITGALSTCVGATTALASVSPFGVWSSSNVSVATVSATGVVTGVSGGTAVITYFVSNPCGTATNTAIVTVNASPSAGTISALITTVCSGSTNILSSTTPGGVWTSGNPSIATVDPATGVVTAISTGSVVITYTVTVPGGCTSFAIYTLNVGPTIPGLAVLPLGSSSLCNGNPVNMHVSSLTPGLTYQWLIDSQPIFGATNSGYVTDTVGLYSVIVSNGICSQLLAGPNVVFMPQPTVGFNPPNLLFTGSYATYQWYKNGVAIAGANTSITTITGVGAYKVIVEDANGCKDTSAVFNVTGGGGGGTSVENTPVITEVSIYPNPVATKLIVDAPIKVNIVVLTMDGRKVMDEQNAKTVDVSKLSSGLYMIVVYDEYNVLLKTAKFTKAE